MPAQPAWFHRLDGILADLRAIESTHLDRLAVDHPRFRPEGPRHQLDNGAKVTEMSRKGGVREGKS